jgi:hypothetical protein
MEEDTDFGFDYRIRKSGEVEILHHGRRAITLRGKRAQEFIAKVNELSVLEMQQEMARLTGNYKRGNERTAARHPRNLKSEE